MIQDDIMSQDKMGEATSLLPVLLPISAILLIWVIRHKDWFQASLLGKHGLGDKILPKSWHLEESLGREWYQGKAVLITGCDSGLGYSLAVHCHSLGMVVIALCHTSSSEAGADALEQLNEDGRMFVVRNWDITAQGAAEAAQREAVRAIEKSGSLQLWAVVNCAALLVMGKMQWQTEEMVRRQLEVNLAGPLIVCKTFLPLLSAGSRIINITSACADTRLPMAGVYAASKAGLEAGSDALRVELAHRQVHVVLLDPGYILEHTPLASRQGAHYKAMSVKDGSEKDLEEFKKFSHIFSNCLPKPGLKIIELESIYRVFEQALTSTNPFRRYSASPLSTRLWEIWISNCPRFWGDGAKRDLLGLS